MLHHSLFTRFLRQNGMKVDKKDEQTRDVICIDFQFGLRSYDEEISHLREMRRNAEKEQDPEKREKLLATVENLEEKTEARKDLYQKLTKDDIRQIFYEEGVKIDYSYKNRKTGEIVSEVINYKMLYRNPSKAKQGSCMFIREELYDIAHDWLTMGLDKKMPEHNAKIVEISAYAPLSTSAIEDTIHIPVGDVLILNDQDSFMRTIADVVKSAEYDTARRVLDEEHFRKTGKRKYKTEPCVSKRCIVERQETDVKNTLWDGMALIESSTLPPSCNGMALLRNHFFKACAFRANIQEFFKDYCESKSLDYSTFTITDIFGYKHRAADIVMVTTDNQIKWRKFSDLMGESIDVAYDYWQSRVIADGCIWGIVKTDHPSKLGDVQQMSYQMINTLPCSKEDIQRIAQTSVEYVELLKADNDEFEYFLRQNATEVNHYEMLADLYAQNHDFANSKMFKTDKSSIISAYVLKLRKGKITVPGDNLTVCGNPYALLLHAVGENWEDDPTLKPEPGVIQCYTPRFADGEYLCGIRNPHNSSNNLGYFKNVKHPLMEKYFGFSDNIMAVNNIHTDVQARMNGMDYDSDFNFVTNQPEMVAAAKIAYEKYPTVVNEIPDGGLTYNNTMSEYARMDSAMQGAQKAIGGSSDTAQLAQSYYWSKLAHGEDDEDAESYYQNTIILAVLAQVAIDGCKRTFDVDANEEILRIRNQPCMNKDQDFPKFIQYTREVPLTKNGKDRPYEEVRKEKQKIRSRIDPDIVCPMNWMEEELDKIQGSPRSDVVPTGNYFIWKKGYGESRRIGKARALIQEYDAWVKSNYQNLQDEECYWMLIIKTQEVLENIKHLNLSQISINHMIASCLEVDNYHINTKYKRKDAPKYIRKTLNFLYKANPRAFLDSFIK